jgi:peptidoglycan/xylan/chitin deacetylase (PgdA/CDA1 family)
MSSTRSEARRLVQRSIRAAHVRFLSKPLPDRLSIYFHSLDRSDEEAFATAIRWISSQGYSFVSADDFLTAPGRVCFVSFDDNYKQWHEALGLFESLGLRATFFTNTSVLRGEADAAELDRYQRVVDYAGRYEPLSRGEIAEMSAAGHWFGSHTHSHVALSELNAGEIEQELRTNRVILEEITGSGVTGLAFPFGMPRHFSPVAKQVAVRLGFRSISWAVPAMLHHQGDPLVIHRTQWNLRSTLDENIQNLHVDGKRFIDLTKRSPVG